MPATALFTDAVVDALRRALHDAAPREFAGLLGGRRAGDEWRVEALALLPDGGATRDAFAVAAADFAAAEAALRARGLGFLGFAHGHPDAPAVPSQRDRAAFWPGCLQAIVGPRGLAAEVRCYWRTDAGVREVRVRAAAGSRRRGRPSRPVRVP